MPHVQKLGKRLCKGSEMSIKYILSQHSSKHVQQRKHSKGQYFLEDINVA